MCNVGEDIPVRVLRSVEDSFYYFIGRMLVMYVWIFRSSISNFQGKK